MAVPVLVIGAVTVMLGVEPFEAKVTRPRASTVNEGLVYVPATTPEAASDRTGVRPPVEVSGAVAVIEVMGAVPLPAAVRRP